MGYLYEDRLANGALDAFIKLPDTGARIVKMDTFFDWDFENALDIYWGNMLIGDYVVVYADKALFNTKLSDNSVFRRAAVLSPLGQETLDSAKITSIQQNPYLGLQGQGVLIGFADTGIDFTNPAFRWEDGSTKIKYIWDQSLSGGKFSEYGYGAEFAEEEINEALTAEDPHSVLTHTDTNGHGTFLASIAASHERGNYRGAAPDSELIVVKLKKASQYAREFYMIPSHDEEVYETADLIQGVDCLIKKARELDRPIVICIGMGTNASGHDGSQIMESYLETVSSSPGVVICCAAGNEGNSAHHMEGLITKPGESVTVSINVSEGAPSAFVVVCNQASERMSVSLVSPTGQILPRAQARAEQVILDELEIGHSKIQITYFFGYSLAFSQITEIRIWDPAPGIWKLIVYGDIITPSDITKNLMNDRFHVWLPLDGQGGEYLKILEPERHYTLTTPANSKGVITCVAYDGRSGAFWPESSEGTIRTHDYKPDIAAPGVDVPGIFPENYGTMSGTSVSAAVVTGACALLMQWSMIDENMPSVNTYMLNALLIRGADSSDFSYAWGFGKLNLYNTFLRMRNE
ncbi:MAG: S8 family peptidase [Clostridiales bacterium]|jgi:subtilisin family serine protease|nr:S8 family peptidase [Clostridiales bacterium]